MFLKRFYSEPNGLFPLVEFKNGINFVFAKKEKATDSKESLNGIGKTLLLDLIDYALLSSETPLIKSAKANNDLKDYAVVLEFTIDGKPYIAKRNFVNPNNNIILGPTEAPTTFESAKDARHFLCDLIFSNPEYPGKYSNEWLRKLLPFFVKKYAPKEGQFADPIKYIPKVPEAELIRYHLFLLGIDNSLSDKNFSLQSELKKREPALTQIKALIQETYGLDDISQAENEADKLHSRINRLEEGIKAFKLEEQYEDVEKESNVLTSKIKHLWYQNFSDREKIKAYQESFEIGDSLNVRRVKNLYRELNMLLADQIGKTLEEAVAFRRQIARSRKEFIAKELRTLHADIEGRETEIREIEEKRARLFKFLEAQDAIADLSEAYLELSKRREELNELAGKIKLYQDLKQEDADLKKEAANLYAEIVSFASSIQEKLSDFRRKFFEIHDAIYVESRDKSSFVFVPNDKKDSKITMDVKLPADLSRGKNQGRTLIYDLAVMFHAEEKGIKCPRFLVHDGIFDGVDKAHFVCLYEYLERLDRSGKKFQYIVTLNEEGTLNENFGHADKVNPDKIAEEAILTLTPSRPLFGRRWD